MSDYIIIMDASGDLDANFANENGVKFLPMPYEIGGEMYEYTGDDDSGIKKFYELIREGKSAKTSQITPFAYKEIFEPYMSKGLSIMYLCLSAQLSSTYQSACSAAKELNEAYPNAKLVPINSLAATGKLGIIAERAAMNKNSGMSLDDNAAFIEGYKNKATSYGFVDNLMHLRRGGRISAAGALLGTLLNIKPLVHITDEGKVGNHDKCSSERIAIRTLKETYEDLANFNAETSVYISDADNSAMADMLQSLVTALNPKAVIKRKLLTPIIGTHLGPESVVISFEKRD